MSNNEEAFYTPMENLKYESISPKDEDFGDHNVLDLDHPEKDFGFCAMMKRSMSMNDIAYLRENIKKENEKKDSNSENHEVSRDLHMLPPHVTQGVGSKFLLERAKSQDQMTVKLTSKIDRPNVRKGLVRPIPFSFDKRNLESKKRKEEKIRNQIEIEKSKASSFKAQPLKGAIKKQFNNVKAKKCNSAASMESKENHTKFAAKPATVLNKVPFKPVLLKHTVASAPFHLLSKKRGEERQKFDVQFNNQKKIKQQQEKERLELAEKALRAKLVHHPKPAPNNAPFVPVKCKSVKTAPKTPPVVKRLHQNKKQK